MRRWGVLIGLAILAQSCASSPTAPTEPIVVTLAPGASFTTGPLTLTFIRITADSRCPGDAICISQGDATAAIETEIFGFRQAFEVSLNAPGKQTVIVGAFRVTFEALAPYPFVSLGPIAPAAYRATFEIRGT